jgi:hypothetical protein
MQNLSDDELDKLFQKAAQDLNPAYDADHWKELNTKLDENENPKGWLSRWSLGIGLAVLFSGSSLLYFTVNNSTSTPDSPLATSLGQEDIEIYTRIEGNESFRSFSFRVTCRSRVPGIIATHGGTTKYKGRT